MRKNLCYALIAVAAMGLVGCGSEEKVNETTTVNETELESSMNQNDSTDEKDTEKETTDSEVDEVVIQGNGQDIAYIGNVDNKSNTLSFVIRTVDDVHFVGEYTFAEEPNIFAFNTNYLEKEYDEFTIRDTDIRYIVKDIKPLEEYYPTVEEYLEYNKISTEGAWKYNDCIIKASPSDYDETIFYSVYRNVSNHVVQYSMIDDKGTLTKEQVEETVTKLNITAVTTLDPEKYYYEDIIAKYIKDVYGIYLKNPLAMRDIKDSINYNPYFGYYLDLADELEDDSVYVGTYKEKYKVYFSEKDLVYHFEDITDESDEPLYFEIDLSGNSDEGFSLDVLKEIFLN